MFTLRQPFTIILCLVHLTHSTHAFLMRPALPKRSSHGSGSQGQQAPEKLFLMGEEMGPTTVAVRHSNTVLTCKFGGSPTPTIHWLKNGQRIEQGWSNVPHNQDAYYEDHDDVNGKRVIRMGSTRSRLYLDCLNDEDEAEYTCVAETPRLRESHSTVLRVEKPDSIMYSEVHSCKKPSTKGEVARIYMWTTNRLEYENSKIQLFCRAQGTPEPKIAWYDRDNKPITDDDTYTILKNGDLLINNISWYEHMGVFTCVAENDLGMDTTEVFLYPARRVKGAGYK